MFRKCTVLAYSAPPVEIVPGLRDLVDTTMSDSQGRFLGHGRRGAQLATQQGQHTTDTVRSSLQQVRETQNPSSFNLNLAAKLEMESQEGKVDQCSDDVSYASEVTMVTSNKSKTESRIPSSIKEILEYDIKSKLEAGISPENIVAGLKKCVKNCINLIHKQRAEDKKEAAELLESYKKEAFFFRQHYKEEVKKLLEEVQRTSLLTKETLKYIEPIQVAGLQKGMKNVINHVHEQQAEDKKEVAELWESDKKEDSLLHQHDKEVKEHQPTDAAMFSDPHTPTERRPQGSEAGSADPSLLSGVGKSLPAKVWSDAQKRYFESLGKCNTGKRWITAIIQKLWDVSGGYHRERILMRRFEWATIRKSTAQQKEKQ